MITEDSYEWALNALFRLRQWWQSEAISVEDAFRTVDRDFDGEISKNDIRMFLLEVLKMDVKELQVGRINRLFKLLD